MNRRNFLSLFSVGVAGLALEQAIPFGRVWSFPKEIVIANPFTLELYSREYLAALKQMTAKFQARKAGELPYKFGKLFPGDVMPDIIL
jgi:hypothetical protein